MICPHGLHTENCPHCNALVNVKPRVQLGSTDPLKLPEILDPTLVKQVRPSRIPEPGDPAIRALKFAPTRLIPSILGTIETPVKSLLTDRLENLIQDRPGQAELDTATAVKDIRKELK